jgi:O-acetyl-ADP-ribose deacetylase
MSLTPSGRSGAAGNTGKAELLASCYRRSIEAARGFESLAFSGISTGVYGFPAPEAARIAVATTVGTVAEGPGALRQVIFCCFSESSADLHRAALQDAAGGRRESPMRL